MGIRVENYELVLYLGAARWVGGGWFMDELRQFFVCRDVEMSHEYVLQIAIQ